MKFILNSVWKLTEGVGELLNFCKFYCGPSFQWVSLCPFAEIQRVYEEFLWCIQTGMWCRYEFMNSLAVRAHLLYNRKGGNGEGWIYLSLEIETWVRGGWGFVAHGVISAWCLEMSFLLRPLVQRLSCMTNKGALRNALWLILGMTHEGKGSVGGSSSWSTLQ